MEKINELFRHSIKLHEIISSIKLESDKLDETELELNNEKLINELENIFVKLVMTEVHTKSSLETIRATIEKISKTE